MECLYSLKALFRNTILVSGLERWGPGTTQKLLHTKTKKKINERGYYSEPGNRNKEEKTQNLRHTGQLRAKRTKDSEDRKALPRPKSKGLYSWVTKESLSSALDVRSLRECRFPAGH